MDLKDMRKDDLVREVVKLRQFILDIKESSRQNGNLANIIEASDDAIIGTTVSGTIVNWNKGAESMYGYTAQEVTGRDISLLAPPEKKGEVLKIREKVESGQRVDHFETIRVRKDGTPLHVSLAVSPLLNSSRETVGISSIARDITKSKLAEAAREEGETRFRELFEHIYSCVAIYKAVSGGDDFVITDFNTTAEKIDNISRKQVIGKRVREVFPGVEEFGLFEVFRRVYKTGTPERHPAALYKDQRISSWRENYVYRLPSGEIVAIYEDVTELKRAEEALLESEAKYRTVVESSLVGVYIMQDGLFRFVNKRWCEIYGYTYDEIVDRVNALDLTPPEDQELVEENLRKRLSGETNHIEYEPRAIRKDGTIIIVKVLGSSTLYQGLPAISGTVIDITEQRRSEEALRASQLHLSEAMDLAHIVYWESDPVDDVFTFNDAFYTFYGTTAEQEGGYRMIAEEYAKRFVHPDDLSRLAQFVEQNTLGVDCELFTDIEHRIVRRNGEVRQILARTRIIKDDSGRIVKRYGANQDITSRKFAAEELQETMGKLRRSLVGTIQAMSSMVETRDPYTAGHQKRVSSLSRVIAQEMGLPNDTIDIIRMAGSIHDIGKISVPAEILSRPTKLTNLEFSFIKNHSQSGYDILKDAELPYPIAEIVLQHHERLDGSGYPQGLKNGRILLESQIIAVADVVEAMSSHRPYRPALGIDATLEEIERNNGVLYDPAVVDTCLKLFREKGFTFEQLP